MTEIIIREMTEEEIAEREAWAAEGWSRERPRPGRATLDPGGFQIP